jgi:hypothetical protein
MNKNLFFILSLVFSFCTLYCQDSKHKWSLGFHYGFGDELKNNDYAYSNRYIKGQFCFSVINTRYFKYELLLQPEVNFARHQLLNRYFVTPDESNFEEKRAYYTRIKNINEYVLNIGVIARKPISKNHSIYLLISVGPMINDTETERLSKGFAFSDVLALGFSIKTNKVILDIRPNLRHVSNAQLQRSNAGYNTKNIEFGFFFPL